MALNVPAVRELVRRLRDEPEDEETRLVLGDWCEEEGFLDAAQGVRSAPGEMARNRALTALRMLFGEDGYGSERGAYDAVLGFPSTVIRPAQTVTIMTWSLLDFRLRRIYISDEINRYFNVHQIRAGKYDLVISDGGVVPASVFGPLMPDLFDEPVAALVNVSIVLENIGEAEVSVTACALGLTRATYEECVRRQKEDVPPMFSSFDVIPCGCPDWWFPSHRRDELRRTPHGGLGGVNHHEACPKRLFAKPEAICEAGAKLEEKK